jgi:excisionase family DNA binding protein
MEVFKMSLPFWFNKNKMLLSVEELAELLQISTRTIYNGTAKNPINKFPIPWIRIGKLLRFHINDVQEYLEKRRTQ